MSKVKVKTLAVIDSNPVGSVIDLSEEDFKWLAEQGYVELIEEVKSATTSKKTSTPRKPRTTRKKPTETK